MVEQTTLLNEKQAAKFLGKSPMTLTKWRFRNRGPAYLKTCGSISYTLADLQAFLSQSRIVPSERPAARPQVRRSKATRRGSR